MWEKDLSPGEEAIPWYPGAVNSSVTRCCDTLRHGQLATNFCPEMHRREVWFSHWRSLDCSVLNKLRQICICLVWLVHFVCCFCWNGMCFRWEPSESSSSSTQTRLWCFCYTCLKDCVPGWQPGWQVYPAFILRYKRWSEATPQFGTTTQQSQHALNALAQGCLLQMYSGNGRIRRHWNGSWSVSSCSILDGIRIAGKLETKIVGCHKMTCLHGTHLNAMSVRWSLVHLVRFCYAL